MSRDALASQPGAASARWSRAAWTGYVAILWLALLVLPVAVPLTSLDSSWYALLAHDWRETLQAGTEQVFTYGPLGWLLTPAPGFDADLFATKMIGIGTAMLAIAVVLAAFVQSLPDGAARLGAALLALLFAPVLQDAVYVVAILAASGLLLARERISVAGACLAAALLAVTGLVKFSHLVLALPCVAGFVAAAWRQHSWRSAAVVAGSFVGAFVLAWVLAGQRLAGIAGYLQNAAEIAAGYHDVMGTHGAALQFGLALACVLLLAGLCLSTAFARPRTPANVTLAAVMLAVVLLTWKSGFVRQDDAHARIFFAMATLAPFALRAAVQQSRRRWSAAATTAAVVIAIAGVGTSLGDDSLWQTPVRLAQRLLVNARALAAPEHFAAEQAEQGRRHAAATPLEQTRRALGAGSIDAFGHEQGILLANSLRLRHRPVFQSYSAYTQPLQETNAACYEAPDGPDHVLFELQPLDGYFPTVADSQALLALFAGYAPQFEERDFLLMRRQPVVRRRADLPQQLVWEGTAEMGNWVDVKATPDAVLLLSLDVGYSALGRLQGIALRPPRLFLEVRLADGTQQRFRIAPAIVRAPFLLDPLVRGTREFLQLCQGDPLPRVQAFRVGNSAGGARGFASSFGVRLLAIAAR
ncbi:MAG TPA: hypothetical protein VFD82_06455 [Planctomycetota bacterium]|nr:hypothetical protein [Planctomycetota bacterium]